jgi:hypothetical protein
MTQSIFIYWTIPTMQKLLEVRCCCQPQKLLGWLPGPDDARKGMKCCFSIKPAGMLSAFSADFVPKFDQLTLSIAQISLTVSVDTGCQNGYRLIISETRFPITGTPLFFTNTYPRSNAGLDEAIVEARRYMNNNPGHLAFKAEGVNLDTLRRVSGFKEFLT